MLLKRDQDARSNVVAVGCSTQGEGTLAVESMDRMKKLLHQRRSFSQAVW